MTCPICVPSGHLPQGDKSQKLDQAILSGVEVDYCPKCLGLWFEEEELRWAKDLRDRDLRWLDIDLWQEAEKFKIAPGQKLCPSDRLPLYETGYSDSGIKVDLCNICHGIWLDRGEFKKIIQYLQERADQEILKHYLKNLRQELWEVFAGPESLKEEVDDLLTILKLLNYKFLTQHPNISKIISGLPK